MRRLIPIFLILLGVSSCLCEETDRIPITVRLDGVCPVTKLSVEGSESGFVNGQVLLFDHATGDLDDYAVCEGNYAKLSAISGKKDIYAVVNAAENYSEVKSIDELLGKIHKLDENTCDALVMTGELLPVDMGKDDEKVVPMRRMVARISVKVITNSLPGGRAFTLDAIYLDNVSSSCTFGAPETPLGWYNRMRYEPENTCDIIADTGLDTIIPNGRSYSVEHFFYALPNPYPYETAGGEWSPRRTRIVIEGRIDGNTVYYPYTLPDIKRNKRYNISVALLTTKGSDDPDKVFGSAIFTIKEKEWMDGDSYIETF